MIASLAVIASAVVSVAAHATFQEMWVNDVDQGNWCVRLPQSNNPVTDVTSNVSFLSFILFARHDNADILFQDLTCNVNPSPASGLCSVERMFFDLYQRRDLTDIRV